MTSAFDSVKGVNDTPMGIKKPRLCTRRGWIGLPKGATGLVASAIRVTHQASTWRGLPSIRSMTNTTASVATDGTSQARFCSLSGSWFTTSGR